MAPPQGDRWGPGTRILAVIVSPFARKGHVDHTVYDTGSIARLIIRRFGLETVSWQSRSIALDSGSLSFSGQQTGRPLLTPDEVRNLREDTELLFLAGQRPIAARKLRYYDQREFNGLFDTN